MFLLVSIFCTACVKDKKLEMGEINFKQDIETGDFHISFTYYNESGKKQISIDGGNTWLDVPINDDGNDDIIMKYDKNTKKFTNSFGWDLVAGIEYEFSFRHKAIQKGYQTSKIENQRFS